MAGLRKFRGPSARPLRFGLKLSFNRPRMDAHRCFSRFWSVPLLFLVAFVVLMAQAAPAHAQDANPDVLNKVTKLNKQALQAFQKRDYDSARDFLKEALDLCKSSGLEKHPIRARTEVHIGIVLIAGYKQRDAGITHFKKALEIQPDIQLTKSVSTKALQDAFEEASVGIGGGGGGDDSGGGAQASNDDNAGGGDSAGGDDNPPPRRRAPPKKKKKRGDDDDDDSSAVSKRKGDDDDGSGDDDDLGGGTNNKGRIFVGISAGGGFGIASGTGEMSSQTPHTLASAGFAPAQLMQFAPEVGYYLASNLLLSVQARVQFVTGLNPGTTTCGSKPCATASTAIAGFAKATYFLGDSDFHFFFGGSLGAGTIRHVAKFPQDRSCGTATVVQNCVDTLAAGPVLVGPNIGILYDFNKTFGLLVAANTQLGVPKFTFNVDADLGLALKF